MKKIGLILFVGLLFATAFTGYQCRKKLTAVPIDTTTQVVQGKDTAGEDVHVIVTQGSIVSGAQPAHYAKLYLINNFKDYTAYTANKSFNSSYVVKDSCDADGLHTFSKVHPSSNPSHSFPGPGGGLYEYHIIAAFEDFPGDTLWGEFESGGNASAFTVGINNGNTNGITIPIAVK